ncbi:hypothetical protein [Actinoplanes sp. DH11]|uniref:hypothetical protein n=1 Tax=Actinoplanes sp. DH11 TaxID=2857011 RepID=UPI001E3B63F9|nr:hypothetical protein [Actinoplanes sp. DH11]
MIWRRLRPYTLLAAVVAVAATGYLIRAAGVVRERLEAAGVPDCRDPNVCYPQGAALDAIAGIHLVAALTPALIGLILGAALLMRPIGAGPAARGAGPVARGIDPAARGIDPVARGIGPVALAAGAVCTGIVAVTHRLVSAPYTVIANDTYELAELTHLNHPAFMVAVTALIIAVAAAVRGGAFTGWSVAPAAVLGGVVVACLLATDLTGIGAPPESFTDDYAVADGFGWAAAGWLTLVTAALTRRRPARALA